MSTERNYRVLSWALIAVGGAFLAVSAFGSWRFGLSLSTDPVDRYWLATIYAGADVAAGVLVATGARMLRHPGYGWKAGGILALLPALVLVTFSILSTFGLMSERITVLASQKAAQNADQGRLAWLRGQTVNRELPKSERFAFRAEEREAAKQARKSASVIADGQAKAIADALGSTPEAVQRGLVFASSTIPLSIKFVCLGFGFFLWGYRSADEPASAQKNADGSKGGSGGGSPGSGGSEPKKPTLVHPEPKPEPGKIRAEPSKQRSVFYVPATGAPERKLSYEQFVHDLRQDMAHGDLASSTRAIARRTGWSQSSVVRHAEKLRTRAATRIRRYAGNGRGYQTPAYN